MKNDDTKLIAILNADGPGGGGGGCCVSSPSFASVPSSVSPPLPSLLSP